MNTPKSVIDLIWPALCRPSCGSWKTLPRIRHALLRPGNTAAIFVDFEDHYFDFVTQLHT
jgi:hypothetical protein